MRPLARLLERLRSVLRRATAGSRPSPSAPPLARESTPDPLEFDLNASPSDEAPPPKDERQTLSPVKRKPISSHPPGRRRP